MHVWIPLLITQALVLWSVGHDRPGESGEKSLTRSMETILCIVVFIVVDVIVLWARS